jgi:hypothetical protein
MAFVEMTGLFSGLGAIQPLRQHRRQAAIGYRWVMGA